MSHFSQNISFFNCPTCQADLQESKFGVTCDNGCSFDIVNKIPNLIVDEARDEIEEKIREFYEQTPFPDYEGLDSINTLVAKADKGGFAKLLDRVIPHNVNVLEVGCGTGQLSNFLSYGGRNIFAVDLSQNSLQLAESFRERNKLVHAGFYRMNLFQPCFKEESFDLVLCNGVLHHTKNPKEGFARIAPLVKKGGYILIGLYNKYGRLTTDLRGLILKIFNMKPVKIDPRVRKAKLSGSKLNAWIKDQYQNPHESRHTIGEVQSWIDEQGFEFVSSIPSPSGSSFEGKRDIFSKHSRGNPITRLVAQLGLLLKTDNEGGFFIVIAQRKR